MDNTEIINLKINCRFNSSNFQFNGSNLKKLVQTSTSKLQLESPSQKFNSDLQVKILRQISKSKLQIESQISKSNSKSSLQIKISNQNA